MSKYVKQVVLGDDGDEDNAGDTGDNYPPADIDRTRLN